MKKISLISAALTAFAIYGAPLQFVSHAGDQFSAPGHSIPSYKVAIEHEADYIKLDLQLTKDNIIVMQHDRTTGRKMDKNFSIAANTYKKLYDECTYKPKGEFKTEKIVRLEQALELIKDSKCNIWFDFKGYSPKRPKGSKLLIDQAMAMLKKYGISQDRVIVATWSQPALQYMKENYPAVRRVLHINVIKRPKDVCILTCKGKINVEDTIPEILKKGEELKLFGFNMPIISKFYEKEWVKQLKDKGYWVSLWFVQQVKGANMAVEAGADAVVTDNIKVVKPAARAAEQKAAK